MESLNSNSGRPAFDNPANGILHGRFANPTPLESYLNGCNNSPRGCRDSLEISAVDLVWSSENGLRLPAQISDRSGCWEGFPL